MNLKEKKTNFIATDKALSTYLKEINRYKVLSRQEEEDLIKKMRAGDDEARKKLISANQRFVYAVAKRYANDDNILDLVNEGNIGLMTALDTFDITKGNRFLSYAIWYIRREINAYLNNDNLLVRKTNNSKTAYKMSKIKAKYFNENNRYPDIHEIADILEKEFGLKIKDINDLLDVTSVSINTCFDDEDERAFENSPDFSSKTSVENDYVEEMDQEYNNSATEALISTLTDREQTIVRMSFGIGYNKEYTNAEIGEEIGMSSERVRQLKNGAIEKMKKLAVAEHFSF